MVTACPFHPSRSFVFPKWQIESKTCTADLIVLSFYPTLRVYKSTIFCHMHFQAVQQKIHKIKCLDSAFVSFK